MIYQFNVQQKDKKTLERFRDALIEYNYTYDYFQQINVNPFTFTQFDLPLLAYRFPATFPFGILFHLFLLGEKVDGKIVGKIFNDDCVRNLTKIKILEKVGDDQLQSSIAIIPYQTYYFASDFIFHLNRRQSSEKQKYEYVYPVSLDSITLCETQIKKPVSSVLDLGCGCGILSLVASQFSKNVIGVDLNPRAVNFSKMNAILNGVYNCKFLCGDLYEPIADEKYDLILSNPPYEIAPQKTYLYKDGGIYGDKVLRRIMQDVSKHLKRTGFCQIITRTAKFNGEKREEVTKNWVSPDRLRVLFIELQKMDIYQYAYLISMDNLICEDKILDYQKYSRKIIELLDFFNKIHLSSVSLGIFNITPDAHFSFEKQNFVDKNIPSRELQNIIKGYFSSLPAKIISLLFR